MSICYRLWLPPFLLGLLLLAGSPAFGQVNLNGNWNSADFGWVTVFQDDEGDVRVLAPPGDKCGRSVYLSGFLVGNQLTGTMSRCTDSELIAKCTHQPIYKIDFTATVSRSSLLFGMGPETGQIKIDSQQLNVAFKMAYWDTTACKEEKVKPLSDLVFRDDQQKLKPVPTPGPTPAPKPYNPCEWTTGGLKNYLDCLGWEWGILDSPYPNKD